MTTAEKPEIGQSAEAGGIRTNRLVLPGLAEDFHVVAPDLVAFGYSDRLDGTQYDLERASRAGRERRQGRP
ncbi:MAG: 2-hydroxymuconate-semialdehyde hydrolase [Pseudonocardiales bacterium]|jgi:pimeloyl-ACP methyl ester carboxylesterase|nr:alpha/beta hydrolase fold protein [Pseudonocardia sp.]MDT7650648.1 2-hydroxymuconate-semialdehyde hydrolase [Pseudonocardiales bacterium]